MRRFTYLIKETLANIRINRTTTLIAIATTGLTLACFGVFLLIYLNLRGMVSSIQDDIQVILYLKEEVTTQEVAQLRQRLEGNPEVASVSYVSKEQALQEFREQFPAERHLLEGLGSNPLPASLIVTMAQAFRSPEAVRRWAARQQDVPGVDQAQYSRDWVENLESILQYLELAALGIGGLLSIAAVTIIANTTRLTLYARREEIDIMRLIGATSAFIRVPYLLEGAVLGALGGSLSVLLLKGCFDLATSQLGTPGRFLGLDANLAFLPGHVSALIVAAGLLLGSTGSLISLLDVGRTRS